MNLKTSPTIIDKTGLKFNPRVFIVTQASYDRQIVIGRWISVATPELFKFEVQELLENCQFSVKTNSDEWFIEFWEGWGDVKLNLETFTNIEIICGLAKVIRDAGEVGIIAINHVGSDNLTAIYNFLNNYQGTFSSIEDHVKQIVAAEVKKFRYVVSGELIHVFKPDIRLDHV